MGKQHMKHEEGPQEPENLAFNEEQGSYEFDVQDQDSDWEHPADYDTISAGAHHDDSTFDNSNPFVGDEYADLKVLEEEELENNQMQVVDDRILKVSLMDKELAKDEEDYRADLDEEGYPKNDS
ncbi:hypothetical protein ACFRAE_15685 [Sphingobacterium sp. HJSM2_6]|uniref:hypothetical protein n=1 Tax=Sphingobacterium sp. HJSM2_6 TaxID=3366264 RepID=UPI003BC5169A